MFNSKEPEDNLIDSRGGQRGRDLRPYTPSTSTSGSSSVRSTCQTKLTQAQDDDQHRCGCSGAKRRIRNMMTVVPTWLQAHWCQY